MSADFLERYGRISQQIAVFAAMDSDYLLGYYGPSRGNPPATRLFVTDGLSSI